MRVRCRARGCLFCYCWLDFDTISSVHWVPFVCTFDVNYCRQMSKRSPQKTAELCWSKSRRRDIQKFLDFRVSVGLLYSGIWHREVWLNGSMVSKGISASIIMEGCKYIAIYMTVSVHRTLIAVCYRACLITIHVITCEVSGVDSGTGKSFLSVLLFCPVSTDRGPVTGHC